MFVDIAPPSVTAKLYRADCVCFDKMHTTYTVMHRQEKCSITKMRERDQNTKRLIAWRSASPWSPPPLLCDLNPQNFSNTSTSVNCYSNIYTKTMMDHVAYIQAPKRKGRCVCVCICQSRMYPWFRLSGYWIQISHSTCVPPYMEMQMPQKSI